MTPTAIHDDELAANGGDIHDLLEGLRDLVSTARSMPLSNSVIVNRDEALEYLDDIVARLPEEVRQARWLLKERDEFLAKVQREGDDILEAARVRAERMVQRTEIVRQAQHTARQTVEDARDEARRLRHEAEDYCDQKLAAFEIVLERTMKTVQAGREKLQIAPVSTPAPADAGIPNADLENSGEVFFDQDDG